MAATPERIAEWEKRVQVAKVAKGAAGNNDEQFCAHLELQHAERMLNLLQRSLTSEEHRVLLARLDDVSERMKEHNTAVAVLDREGIVLYRTHREIEQMMGGS